jgi:hypothetical protein
MSWQSEEAWYPAPYHLGLMIALAQIHVRSFTTGAILLGQREETLT